MIRRWTHVHSLATGLVFGLVLDKEALVLFGLGIALGAGVVFGWSKLRQLAGWGREAAHGALSSVERLREAEAERKLAAAAELRSRAENRVRRAGEQAVEERRAYWRGAVDGGKTWSELENEPPTTILGVPVPVRDDA